MARAVSQRRTEFATARACARAALARLGEPPAPILPGMRGVPRWPPSVCWDRLLFCAKEAAYKAWFPVAQRWLGFDEADITIDAKHGTFSARLLVPGPLVAAMLSSAGRRL